MVGYECPTGSGRVARPGWLARWPVRVGGPVGGRAARLARSAGPAGPMARPRPQLY